MTSPSDTVVITPSSFGPDRARCVIEAAKARRRCQASQSQRRAAGLGAAVIAAWLVAVSAFGLWPRVTSNLSASVTMIFGSFVAGSTPQGGGAVAFPVFTKVLGVSAADAAVFSLSIQAIGMGTASAAILLTRRCVDRRALAITIPAAIAGYLFGMVLVAWIAPPASFAKVLFTLVIAAAGIATVKSRRDRLIEHRVAASLDSFRQQGWVALVAAVGGMASVIFGSGADIAVYLALTIVLGVRPSIGVATSVMTMAAVSVVGLVLSIVNGNLSIAFEPGQTDIFGLWLAAVPVVVIGAPIGSWFASRISGKALATFIGALAALEVVTTVVFLDELRSDPVLAGFGLVGLALTLGATRALLRLRRDLARQRGAAVGSVRRIDIEVAS